MNYLTIAGHLGADPEVRFTSSGKKVTTLRVATHSRRGNVDETIWWRATIWGEQFDKMVSYLKKGSPVVLFGDMQKPEIFTDRDGKPQISMNLTVNSIQFSPFGKPDRSAQDGQQAVSAGVQETTNPYLPPAFSSSPAKPGQAMGETLDDEIPF